MYHKTNYLTFRLWTTVPHNSVYLRLWEFGRNSYEVNAEEKQSV